LRCVMVEWLVFDDSFPVHSGTVAHRSFVL
jgi:hypothetical protein